MKEREEGRMDGKGENGIVEGSSDCEDDRSRLRPADIDADVREMERRKRVEAMMSSRLFREELERIVEAQMRDGAAAVGPLLQQIQDMIQTGPARTHNSFSVKNTSCVIPINDIRGVESMGYAKGEKILRCKLAAVYRLMDLYGWTQGINNHITGRLNQEEELLLVNAYGMLYHEITASSLVRVDMQGNIVEPGTTNYGVNVQGFHLHAAIHQARPDIKCIIHVHTPSVLAVSSLKVGLLPLSNESVVIGEVSLHHFSGSLQEPEEKDKLARNLGPINKVMLLSNNGAVCCGETVEEAFFNVYNTVLACESQMKVMPLGVDNLVLMQDETRKAIYDSAHKVPDSTALPSTTGQLTENKEKRWRIGGLHFEALMRMLDNAGFRTGYIYRTPLVKGEPPKPKSDVEVPPAVSSLGYLLEEEEMYRNWKKMGATKNDRTRWLNSPNVYQKVEILETGTPDPKKITKWVADGSPAHSSTPVKISDALQFVPKNTNPKEFKKLQQQIKENRRADKITSGPQSHILEEVSWEQAKKLQDANITNTGDQVVLVGAASKGIIQREFQHNATVYKTPYAKNPFDSISAQEIEEYKRTVQRKQRGESYDEDQSESEALSSSAALPPSGLKSPPSETDDDSRTEPRVLRIETKTAPTPIQAEFVLSDDGPRKLETLDRIRCFTRVTYTPSPARRETPIIVDLSAFKKPINNNINNLKICFNCKRFFNTNIEGTGVSTKSTQTRMSINDLPDEVTHASLTLPVKKKDTTYKKRPVVRKLPMDEVIDELKDKFRCLDLYSDKYNAEVDLDKDKNENNSEEDDLLMTSYTLYKIKNPSFQPKTYIGNDFTSDETITTQSSHSPSEEISQINNNISNQQLASHIGNDFECGESMSEKLSSFPKNLNVENISDSFILSDFLSNVHIGNTDGDTNSSMSNNINVTFHTNRTKKAFLLKNRFIMCRNNMVSYSHTNNSLYDVPNKIDKVPSMKNEENLPCIETLNSLNNLREQSYNTIELDDNTKLEELTDFLQLRRNDDEIQSSINKEMFNSSQELNYDSFNNSVKEPSSFNQIPLIIDGKDMYRFYKEFDPNEVFQSDPDNFSIKAFYDSQSILECDAGDTVLTNIIEEDNEDSVSKTDQPVLVDENIFKGKKYLLKRYLSDNKIDIQLSKALSVMSNCDSLNPSDDSIDFKSKTDKDLNSIEICNVVSEDSAIDSGMITENGQSEKTGYDNIIEWNLSSTSKEGSLELSGDSSGVRMSYTSDDELPEKPVISSIDEFRIKEIVCNGMSDFDHVLISNSRVGSPTDYETSLNYNNRLKLNTNKLLPDVSMIRSYYTLVPFDQDANVLDKSNIKRFYSNENKMFNQDNSKCCSGTDKGNMNLKESESQGLYISDEFVCQDSESELSDGSNIVNFLNNSNNVNFNECGDDKLDIYGDPVDLECADYDCDTYIKESALSTANDSTTLKIEENIYSQISAANFLSNESNYFFTKKPKKNVESFIGVSSSYMSDTNYNAILPRSFSRSIKRICPDIENNNACQTAYKDCLKCFANSMEESIDFYLPDQQKRNHIIRALKLKFADHKCNLSNIKVKKSFKNIFKNKKLYSKRVSCDDLKYSENIVNVMSEKCLRKDGFSETNTYNLDDYTCDDPLIKISNNDEVSQSVNDESINADKMVLNNLHSTCRKSMPFLLDRDGDIEASYFDSTKDQTVLLERSESYFSIHTSSVDSCETEFYSAIGDSICKNSQSRDCSSIKTSKTMSSSFDSYFCSDPQSFDLSDCIITDHDTTFLLDPSIVKLNSSVNSDDHEQMDEYLQETDVNVSNVSCQTDESYQDSIFDYQPEDFSEKNEDSMDCQSDLSNNSSATTKSYESHSQQLNYQTESTTPLSLYTIYETSLEFSPEY